MDRNKNMGELFDLVLQKLMARVNSQDAKPQDFSNAIKFLQNNGIEALPEARPGLNELAKAALAKDAFTGPDAILQ